MENFKQELQALLKKYPEVREVHVKHQPEWDINVNPVPVSQVSSGWTPTGTEQPWPNWSNGTEQVLTHTSSGTKIINLNPDA